jgi:geranylgeranyl reductase family protein
MVLVLGGGPAGATAARALARAGVTVRLLDRSKFPRNKPCGGGISIRVLKRFPYLERELGRIATHMLSRLYLEGPSGESTVIESDTPAALMIRRYEFDALLVDLAAQAGAEIVGGVDIVRASMDASRVTLEARDGRRFSGSMVIAADGVHSIIARRLGLNDGWPATSVALDMMEETPRANLRDVDPHTLWVSYGYASPDASAVPVASAEGYAYIFPKRDHVNIGIGYVLDHYRRHVDQAPYEMQRTLVEQLRRRGIVEGESVRRNFTPFIIPVGGPLRRPGRGRVLLAGDAAGFVNGFTAEGIYYAMVSGELAARAIVETPANEWERRAAGCYRRACENEMSAELRDSVVIRRYLFGDRRRIAAVINGAAQYPVLTNLFLDYARGRVSYARLRRTLMTTAPKLAARLALAQLRDWGRARSVVS